MKISPKNWESFQHYKDRSPAWIKLHKKLLDDFSFSRLPVASRALAPMLWLLASEYEHGEITASFEELSYRLRISEDEVRSALNPLVDAGFFAVASDALAECERDAMPRREENKRENKREKNTSEKKSDDLGFEEFYKKYPRHEGRGQAEKAYRAAIKLVARDELLAGLERAVTSWAGVEKKFIPLPATWLNGKRWLDELDARPMSKTYSVETDPAYRGVTF